MRDILLAIATSTDQHSYFALLGAVSISILSFLFLKKARKKLLIKILSKKAANRGQRRSESWPVIRTLLIIFGSIGLLGLLFSWNIALWVVIGLVGLIIIFALAHWKFNPKPLTPEQSRRRTEENRKSREYWRKKNDWPGGF